LKSPNCGSNSTKRIWLGRKAWKERQTDFKIENIRFVHDPYWNKRVFSLQAAHGGHAWFWQATHMLVLWGVPSI
jgi:hypothetical protein